MARLQDFSFVSIFEICIAISIHSSYLPVLNSILAVSSAPRARARGSSAQTRSVESHGSAATRTSRTGRAVPGLIRILILECRLSSVDRSLLPVLRAAPVYSRFARVHSKGIQSQSATDARFTGPPYSPTRANLRQTTASAGRPIREHRYPDARQHETGDR